MNLCHSVFRPAAFVAPIFFGISWTYWLYEIHAEANETLPESQRIEWKEPSKIPPGMHRLWDEHAKTFPESWKRIYAAVSILLFFLIPIASVLLCLLISGIEL
jgi:hypothetical protein